MNIQKNQEYTVEIIDNGYEGEGIAKIDNFTIFIPGAIKGEKVKILIVKVLSSHAFGKIMVSARLFTQYLCLLCVFGVSALISYFIKTDYVCVGFVDEVCKRIENNFHFSRRLADCIIQAVLNIVRHNFKLHLYHLSHIISPLCVFGKREWEL